MLKRNPIWCRGERGDTLIEVTFALAILSVVLLSCTALTAAAFRTGQTAKERTEVVEAAQEQLEALRSFRDNHTWGEFRTGQPPNYYGVTSFASFHMELASTGGGNEWVPKDGVLTTSTPGTVLKVPTSSIVITTATPPIEQQCGFDFVLQYSFAPLGGGTPATGQITTRLANLKYNPDPLLVVCP
jgi:type II secretory pathway pseudopilin PulG